MADTGKDFQRLCMDALLDYIERYGFSDKARLAFLTNLSERMEASPVGKKPDQVIQALRDHNELSADMMRAQHSITSTSRTDRN